MSENPAHPAFYEYQDKTENQYINVCSSEKMEAIGCLIPELWSEMDYGCGMLHCFYVVMVKAAITV